MKALLKDATRPIASTAQTLKMTVERDASQIRGLHAHIQAATQIDQDMIGLECQVANKQFSPSFSKADVLDALATIQRYMDEATAEAKQLADSLSGTNTGSVAYAIFEQLDARRSSFSSRAANLKIMLGLAPAPPRACAQNGPKLPQPKVPPPK
jgi:hypothetical protein